LSPDLAIAADPPAVMPFIPRPKVAVDRVSGQAQNREICARLPARSAQDSGAPIRQGAGCPDRERMVFTFCE
jgi:hypothetical protein